MRCALSILFGASIFALSAGADAGDAGPIGDGGLERSECTSVAPGPEEPIPINAPAFAINPSGAKDFSLTGPDGRVEFVTGPTADSWNPYAQLVMPIGPAPGLHDLAFVAGCSNGIEHHAITFGAEVAFPTVIGRIVSAEERGVQVQLEIELSPEATAYAPVTSAGFLVNGTLVEPPNWYGRVPAYFARSGRTVTARVPGFSLDKYCKPDGRDVSLTLGFATHVAGTTEDPPPLTTTVAHHCAPAASADGGVTPNRDYADAGDFFEDWSSSSSGGGGCACDTVGARGATRFASVFAAAVFGIAAALRRARGRRQR